MSENFQSDLSLDKRHYINKYIQFLHVDYDKALAEKYLSTRFDWMHKRATWHEVNIAFTAMKKGGVAA